MLVSSSAISTLEFSSAPDTTLPVLELWEEGGRLRARLSDLDDDGGEMQRFEALGTSVSRG